MNSDLRFRTSDFSCSDSQVSYFRCLVGAHGDPGAIHELDRLNEQFPRRRLGDAHDLSVPALVRGVVHRSAKDPRLDPNLAEPEDRAEVQAD